MLYTESRARLWLAEPALGIRLEDIVSNQERRDELLQEPHIAVLATVGPGGNPHAAPMWYLYEDGVFFMVTDRGSQKHRNIERHPEVTLVVHRPSLPYYAVMVQGVAEVCPPLSEEAHVRLVARYAGEDAARAYVASTADEGFVFFQLRPRKFLEFSN